MKKILLSTLLLASLINGPAQSADKVQNNKTILLPQVNVIANKESLTATDTKAAHEKVKTIPGSVGIVESKELQNKFSVTVKDMLDFVPGVIAQPKAGQESRLSIRGSGLSRNFHLRGINLYQDGIPINLADGAADFQDMDVLAMDHIEVYKGANGLQFGSATLGGAINFVSSTGYNASPFSTRVEAGSFGTRRGQISSGKVIGKFDYYVSLSEFHSDGYRNQNAQNDSKFYSNFGYRINGNVENRTYLTMVNSKLELPGALTRTQMNSDPKMANTSNVTGRQERNFDELRIANKTSWVYDNISANAGIYTNLKDLDHPIFQIIDQKTENFGAFADSTFKGNISGLKNEFLIGTNLSSGTTDSKRFTNISGSRGALTVDGDEKAETANLYLQDTLHTTEKLSLIAGLQFIYSKRDYRDRFLSDGDQSGVREYRGTSPKIGAVYDYEKNLQFYTNLSAAYEPPTFTEVRQTTASGLANISAQKSYTFEIGTRRTKEDINWDLALYRSHLRDELMLYTIAPNTVQAVNADKTIHQGVELGFDAKLLQNILDKSGDKLIWKTAYTYNDFRFDGDSTYGNNKLPGAPEHYIRTEFRYDNPVGFYITPSFEISPKGFAIDSANTVKSSSYWLLGLGAGIDFNKNLGMFFDARNLLNKNYSATADVLSTATTANPSVYYPGNSRSFYAGLKYKW